MADPGLVKQLVDAGCEKEDAIAQVDAVSAAILAQLHGNRSVFLPGVGTLKAPEAVVKAPAPAPLGKLRKQRKATLRGGKVIEAGEPFDPAEQPKKRRYYGNGIYA